MSKLSWASPLIPRYKTLVAPIEKMLLKPYPVWICNYTLTLNTLVAMIFWKFFLKIPDWDLPLTILVGRNDQEKMAHTILIKQQKGEERLVAITAPKSKA